MTTLFSPSLYQINTRVWLEELSRQLGRRAVLDDMSDAMLDQIANLGFDWVWMLGIWQTGNASREVSRTNPQWREEFLAALPDLTEDDICGSPFAIQSYEVKADFGGADALLGLRRKLHQRGLRLLLDFVPNHTALDHPWVYERPEFYIQAQASVLAQEPLNYRQVETVRGPIIVAHGRDPYFPGWSDTAQLNYRHATLRTAMSAQLLEVAKRCDGVRCDMAMLVVPEVFQRTWGEASRPADGTPPQDAPFWPQAIARVRKEHPDFLFIAEVYWDMEWELQQQGFDYTYDKRLYDRLRDQDGPGVRAHLSADPGFQHHLVRFIENHDEPRAANVFPPSVHRAATVLTFFLPGMRFFHEGQLEGRRHQVSMHLGRRPSEPPDPEIRHHYLRLLKALQLPEARRGSWRLLECRTAWDGNPTRDRFIAFTREGQDGGRLLVAVNYGSTQGQCYVHIPFDHWQNSTVLLRDLMSPAVYERHGSDLLSRGLYLDLPAWGFHVFTCATRQ